MVYEVNGYSFRDETIKRMKDLIKLTDKEEIEYGFILCKKGDLIVPGKLYKGTEKQKKDRSLEYPLELPNNGCKEDEKRVGSFHTHPKDKPILSLNDRVATCKDNIACVGGSTPMIGRMAGRRLEGYLRPRICCAVRNLEKSIEDCKKSANSLIEQRNKINHTLDELEIQHKIFKDKSIEHENKYQTHKKLIYK